MYSTAHSTYSHVHVNNTQKKVRGSIPTFWSQETSMTAPKPPIVLNRCARLNTLVICVCVCV